MIEWLKDIDKDLFLFLNGLHTPWLDPVMKEVSGNWIWIPLYLVLIYLLFRHYRYQAFWLLLMIVVGITISDQLTSGLMKPFFERLRPSRDPDLTGLVHMVDGYRGGMYGFASSHASNTFFTATFIFLCLRNRYQSIKWLFLWSALVSYSRIYLGVHFPFDIIAGGLIGFLIGFGLVYALRKFKVVPLQIPSNKLKDSR